ncbi:hypothetical protein [Geminocystis herdmanii]|uniref:hypothetical protein n=1 Tax=Geminocystis herdmanii TaxID=669359 RepID=UPI000347EEF3|nr:hypothetical protein [Geminocystis herdmanii]
MLGLSLRFRSIASQLRVLNFHAKDLTEEHLLKVIKQLYPKKFDRAVKMRLDLTDSFTLWEILGIDAVILLENNEGKSIRVGVSLSDKEKNARNLVFSLKSQEGSLLREALNIQQYWVFLVKWKDFPQTPEEWIDILYREIDELPSYSGCRLIIL